MKYRQSGERIAGDILRSFRCQKGEEIFNRRMGHGFTQMENRQSAGKALELSNSEDGFGRPLPDLRGSGGDPPINRWAILGRLSETGEHAEENEGATVSWASVASA